MESRESRRWALLLIIAVGLTIRLVLVPFGGGPDHFTTHDSASYRNITKTMPASLWSPKGTVVDDSLDRTPGYPIFLWITTAGTGNAYAAVIANAFIGGVLTVLLTFLLARELAPARPALWLVAAFLVAVEPVSVAYSYLVLTETLFAACFVAFLYFGARLVRSPTFAMAAATGAALSVSTLVRPTTIYLAPVLVILYLVTHPTGRSFLLAAAFAATALVPVGVWVARNHHVSGVSIYSTIEGTNTFGLRAADAIAREKGISLPTAQAELDATYAKQLSEPNFAKRSEFRSDEGRTLLLRHPKGWLLSAVAGLRAGLAGAAYPWIEAPHAMPPTLSSWLHPVLLLTTVGGMLLMYALVTFGLVPLIRDRKWSVLTVLVLPATYYFLISAGPEMKARFRVPIVPEMSVLAAFGILALWDWVMHRRQVAQQSELVEA